jgi:hypothetical protein
MAKTGVLRRFWGKHSTGNRKIVKNKARQQVWINQSSPGTARQSIKGN